MVNVTHHHRCIVMAQCGYSATLTEAGINVKPSDTTTELVIQLTHHLSTPILPTLHLFIASSRPGKGIVLFCFTDLENEIFDRGTDGTDGTIYYLCIRVTTCLFDMLYILYDSLYPSPCECMHECMSVCECSTK